VVAKLGRDAWRKVVEPQGSSSRAMPSETNIPASGWAPKTAITPALNAHLNLEWHLAALDSAQRCPQTSSNLTWRNAYRSRHARRDLIDIPRRPEKPRADAAP